ncbi:MAG: inorganic pyrophosphatase [Prevotellaceae bacterium]|jgi:inorganic pyrophosphatase|nr:inorganic pyrophosphatase [Prevotellaceae bacterium]
MYDSFDPIVGRLMGMRYKSHPWHGISFGKDAPKIVTCFIEIVPTDTVKYEVDKISGYLRIDRPQKYSNVIPALYGFIPQTYCGELVAEMSREVLQRFDINGDEDPIDICVLTEKVISHGDILVKARPIGGFRLIDGNQADDKLIAVMDNDAVYGDYNDISDIPSYVLERLKHYFITYKDIPGVVKPKCELVSTYGMAEAHEVIERSIQDYRKRFSLEGVLNPEK